MKSLAEIAIEKRELPMYLAGYPDYKIHNPYADSPTYPQEAFIGLESMLASSEDFRTQFQEALATVSQDKEYGWMTLYYVRQCKSFELNHGVVLLPDPLLVELGMNLKLNKGYFESNKKWLGAMYSNGLWGDIESMGKSLSNEFGISVIPV
jgi:hypothetical protein